MTNPKTAGVAVSESSLRRLAGSYLLYERILARFEVSRGRLVRVDEPGRRALVPRSETGFSDGARRYLFVLDSGGKPQGVRIVDPEYDPSIAENSVLYLAANLTTLDAPRAPKPEWSRFTGRYAGTFIGQSVEVRVSLRDGYLMIDDTLRIFDESDGTFATADGERVELDGTRLSIGNRLYHR